MINYRYGAIISTQQSAAIVHFSHLVLVLWLTILARGIILFSQVRFNHYNCQIIMLTSALYILYNSCLNSEFISISWFYWAHFKAIPARFLHLFGSIFIPFFTVKGRFLHPLLLLPEIISVCGKLEIQSIGIIHLWKLSLLQPDDFHRKKSFWFP